MITKTTNDLKKASVSLRAFWQNPIGVLAVGLLLAATGALVVYTGLVKGHEVEVAGEVIDVETDQVWRNRSSGEGRTTEQVLVHDSTVQYTVEATGEQLTFTRRTEGNSRPSVGDSVRVAYELDEPGEAREVKSSQVPVGVVATVVGALLALSSVFRMAFTKN